MVESTMRIPVGSHPDGLDKPTVGDIRQAGILHLVTGNTAGFKELVLRLFDRLRASAIQAAAFTGGGRISLARDPAGLLSCTLTPQFWISELTNEMSFHGDDGSTCIAMRQLEVLLKHVKIQGVTTTAMVVHGDRFEVLTIFL